MELLKETVRIARTVYKGETKVMTEGDVIVPDIKPDILKLLQVDANSYITEITASEGRLDINGRVDMTILYIPDREGEKIRSVEESFDFTHKIENGKISEGMNAEVVSNVSRVEFSALNSRKVKIKASVGIDYEVCGVYETQIPFEIGEEVQSRHETVKLRSVVDMSTHSFTVRENMEIPNGQSSVNEVLKVDVKILDSEYKAVSGKVVAKGTMSVCVLYTDEEMNIEYTEAELPFTEVFDGEDISEDTVCDIEYSVRETQSKVDEDSDGDRRIISLNIMCDAQIKAEDEVCFDMISDCYIPGERTIIEQNAVEIEEVIASPSVQNTIREFAEFGTDVPGVDGVYNVIAKAYVQKAQLQRGKLLCEGKIDAYILYLSDSTDSPVYSLKKEIPFSYMLECEAAEEGYEPQVKTEIRHIGYSLNSNGAVELRIILSISANIIRRRTINVIDSVEKGEGGSGKRGIVIYFVQSGDTLWDIAKHYAVPYDDVIEFNKLEENKRLVQGQRLFIP